MRLPIFRYQGQPPPEKDLSPAPLPARTQNPNRIILRYTLFGVLFGCLFPIFATLLQFYTDQLPFTLDNLRQVYQNNPLLWIISTAPFFLGLFAFLAGTRQARAARLNQELSLRLNENADLTRRLEALNTGLEQEIERRIIQLRTAAQIAQEANSYRELGQLLSQAVSLISNRFGFYHTGIFLNDADKSYTRLRASNSEGGQRMLERGHALKIGEVGIVGYVAASGQARIALDVGKDPVYFDNPDLPETRSEIALPIKTTAQEGGAAVLGVLDIQSTKPGAFDEKDLIALQIIADSLAGAIENARLFSEAQANLEQIQALHRQYVRRAWGEAQEKSGELAYSFQAAPDRATPGETQPALTRSVRVPLRLRDQSIGGLTLEAPLTKAPPAAAGIPGAKASSEWTAEELALIEAVTNQAAQALENARLLEQVQSRAAQEELINRIVSRAQSSLSLDTVMKIAVQEIGQALKAQRVRIRLSISGDGQAGSSAPPIADGKIEGFLNREAEQ